MERAARRRFEVTLGLFDPSRRIPADFGYAYLFIVFSILL